MCPNAWDGVIYLWHHSESSPECPIQERLPPFSKNYCYVTSYTCYIKDNSWGIPDQHALDYKQLRIILKKLNKSSNFLPSQKNVTQNAITSTHDSKNITLSKNKKKSHFNCDASVLLSFFFSFRYCYCFLLFQRYSFLHLISSPLQDIRNSSSSISNSNVCIWRGIRKK